MKPVLESEGTLSLAVLALLLVAPVVLSAPAGAQTSVLRVTVGGGGQIRTPGGDLGAACYAAMTTPFEERDYCELEVPTGDEISLVVDTDQFSLFGGFSGDCSGSDCTLAMNGDMEVAATFGSCPGAHEWSARYGSTGHEVPTALAIDGQEIVVAGWAEGVVDFGLGPSPVAGDGRDAFVARFGATGSPVWARVFGGRGQDEARAIAVDASGDVYVAGFFHYTTSFDSTQLDSEGLSDIFVAKLSGMTGSVLWAKAFGDVGADAALGLAVSTTQVVVTGRYDFTVDFGAFSLSPQGSDPDSWSDVFTIGLAASDGMVNWANAGGGIWADAGRSVALDASGEAAIGGLFFDDATFGATTLMGPDPAGQAADLFVARYDAAGVQQDVFQVSNLIHPDHPYDVVFLDRHPDGGILLGGNDEQFFSGRLAKLTVLGAEQWSLNPGYIQDAAVAGDGSVYYALGFRGLQCFDDCAKIMAATASSFDVAVVKVAGTDGARIWSQRFGGFGDDMPRAIALDADGHLVVAGTLDRAADFCGGPLGHGGGQDMFLLELDSDLDPTIVTPALIAPAPIVESPPGTSQCIAPPTVPAPPPVGAAPTFSALVVPDPTTPGAFVTGSCGVGSGDLDGDGDHDVILCGAPGVTEPERRVVLQNDGSGQLTEATPAMMEDGDWLQHVASNGQFQVFDANSDGRDDAYVVQYGADARAYSVPSDTLFIQQPNGKLRDESGRMEFYATKTEKGAVGDIDCDGDVDLFFDENNRIDYHLMRVNDGDGRFHLEDRFPDGPPPSSDIGFCDVDRDGDPDLVAFNGSNHTLLLNDGLGFFTPSPGGTFPDIGAGWSSLRGKCVDYDLDGFPDLATIDYSALVTDFTLRLLHNTGDGTFTDASASLPTNLVGDGHIRVGDVNADGWPDLVPSADRSGAPMLFLNTGGSFSDSSSALPAEVGFTVADLLPFPADADADFDLFAMEHNGPVNRGRTFIANAALDPGEFALTELSVLGDPATGHVTLSVNRSGGDDGAVAVSYRTLVGTAVPGNDYQPTSGSLSWVDGQAGDTTFQVTLLPEDLCEPERTFRTELLEPWGGARLGATERNTITLPATPVDLVLTDPPLGLNVTFKACTSITVGTNFSTSAGQSVTLRAGDHVTFEDGTEVVAGSTLTVANE